MNEYEYETDPALPEGWEVAVRSDGLVIVCSPGTCPEELGWCWLPREEALAAALAHIETL